MTPLEASSPVSDVARDDARGYVVGWKWELAFQLNQTVSAGLKRRSPPRSRSRRPTEPNKKGETALSGIPLSQIVNVVPRVITQQTPSNFLDPLILTHNMDVVGPGDVIAFGSQSDVASLFGPDSIELQMASVIFGGLKDVSRLPTQILFAGVSDDASKISGDLDKVAQGGAVGSVLRRPSSRHRMLRAASLTGCCSIRATGPSSGTITSMPS